MIPVTTRAGQNIAVFGLGASGLAAAKALLAGGARVSAWDDSPAGRDAAGAADIPLADIAMCDWGRTDALVLAPGVPLTHPAPHPAAAAALAAGRPVIGDIELLREACPDARLIAITGTNGKSTVTALVGHIFHASNRPAEIGGNIGAPALTLDPAAAGGTYILELSSFQLDLTRHAWFDIAVLLNISPDHFDRHGDMAGYVAAKRRIFRAHGMAGAQGPQTAIIGIDDEAGRSIRDAMKTDSHWTVIPVSGEGPAPGGVYAERGMLIDAMSGAPRAVMPLNGLDALAGAHNAQNIAAAYAACRVAGIGADDIAKAVPTFAGLPHRLEPVATIGGIRYVNDSKATNIAAALKAIAAFETVYWIGGGRAKGADFAALASVAPNIRHAFLIGEAAPKIAAALPKHTARTEAGDLAGALKAAHALAESEGIAGAAVLLSPACASFDQFNGFAARGDAFRQAVASLKQEVAS